jgi:hypothetical protein
MYNGIIVRMWIFERQVKNIRTLKALGQTTMENLVSRIGSEFFANINNISGHMQPPCQLYFGYSYICPQNQNVLWV